MAAGVLARGWSGLSAPPCAARTRPRSRAACPVCRCRSSKGPSTRGPPAGQGWRLVAHSASAAVCAAPAVPPSVLLAAAAAPVLKVTAVPPAPRSPRGSSSCTALSPRLPARRLAGADGRAHAVAPSAQVALFAAVGAVACRKVRGAGRPLPPSRPPRHPAPRPPPTPRAGPPGPRGAPRAQRPLAARVHALPAAVQAGGGRRRGRGAGAVAAHRQHGRQASAAQPAPHATRPSAARRTPGGAAIQGRQGAS
jgi:hypothetical protein